jgi:hypothetical protein
VDHVFLLEQWVVAILPQGIVCFAAGACNAGITVAKRLNTLKYQFSHRQ